MVGYDIKDHFDVFSVGGIHQIFEGSTGRFQTGIHFGEIPGMVTMVIEWAPVLHHGRDPDGSEAHVFDVVQAFDQSFKITPPGYVLGIGDVRIVDTRNVGAPFGRPVVGAVAVVETGWEQEIDRFFPEIDLSASIPKYMEKQ